MIANKEINLLQIGKEWNNYMETEDVNEMERGVWTLSFLKLGVTY